MSDRRTDELTWAEENELRDRDPQKFRSYAKTQIRAAVGVLIAGIVWFLVVPHDWHGPTGTETRWTGLWIAGAGIVGLALYGWRLRRRR